MPFTFSQKHASGTLCFISLQTLDFLDIFRSERKNGLLLILTILLKIFAAGLLLFVLNAKQLVKGS